MEEDKERHKPTIPIIRPTHKPPPIPKDFGEYMIKEEVGCGGMGWVFKAVHKKLDVIHALKILHPALSQHEEFVSNFKREAQLAAKLQHPSIVIIHNTGEFGGYHYIAMEFIEGDNLAKRLPDKGIPHLVALSIAVKILDALDHAHNYEFSYQGRTYYGLIHRDVKPENIIIVDETGDVKITDFGIARGIHLYGDVTTEGTIVGTPSYMSPEQIDGSEKITHTTDIYSSGVVLYELLSGKKAFSGTTTQIIKRISNHEYEPLGKVNRKIPNEVIKIVDKAMNFAPDQRFQSAYEMRVEVNRYLSQYQYGEPSTVIKDYFKYPTRPPRPPKPKPKGWLTKLLVGMAKVLGVIALILVIFFGLRYLIETLRKNSAESALVTLEQKLNESQEKYAVLTFTDPLNLYKSANEKFLSEDYKETKTLCDSATAILDSIIFSYRKEGIETRRRWVSKRIDIAKKCGSEVEFSTRYLVPAQSFIEAGEFDNADSVLNEALAVVNQEIKSLCLVPPPPPPEKKQAKERLAQVRESLAGAKKVKPEMDFSHEERVIAQAQELFDQELYSESVKKSDEADRAIAEKMIPPPPCPRVATANKHYRLLSKEKQQKLKRDQKRMNDLAQAGQCEAADVFATNILKEEIEEEEVEVLSDSACLVRGEHAENRGDRKSALDYYGKVRPADKKTESWKLYLPARFRMGLIYHYLREYDKAISQYKEVLSLGNTDYYVTCYLNAGMCFFEISEYDSAIAYFEQVERNKHRIVPDKSRGEKSFKDTDYWHDTMYHWALALTRLYSKEKEIEKKKKLHKDAIWKWEYDYLEHYAKDIDHPTRGGYVENAQTLVRNLRMERLE